MSWDDDAPPKATECRDRLLASSATFSAKFPVARCHFPTFNIRTDLLPASLFQRFTYRAERHAPGESYGKGQVTVVLYFDAEVYSIGQAERIADTICDEVCQWEGEGLCVTSCVAAMATDPSDAQRAAANDTAKGRNYRTITLLLDWEG